MAANPPVLDAIQLAWLDGAEQARLAFTGTLTGPGCGCNAADPYASGTVHICGPGATCELVMQRDYLEKVLADIRAGKPEPMWVFKLG